MSFQDVRTSLAIGYSDVLLNDEEFILLYNAFKSPNPVYPYWKFNRFCLDDLESSECELRCSYGRFKCSRNVYMSSRNNL